ncbi:hypothetical protein RJ639_024874, partial [Escallonia herrerae]
MARIISTLMLILSVLLCFEASGIAAQTGKLPEEEVDALKEIAEQLGKSDWDFNLNPCDGNSNWSTQYYSNSVSCNCSNPGFHHHWQSYLLSPQCKAFRITLVYHHWQSYLLSRLLSNVCSYLSSNYLSGPIPPEWASTKLESLYLGNNLFSGTVPAELGSLVNLKQLYFTANNLTGGLPLELNKLTRLTGLRISDLNGEGSEFPVLSNITGMQKLMLRSCNISGKIPDYIAHMPALDTLDLSFNKLEGDIPNLGHLGSLKDLYLTGNILTGPIPDWVKGRDTEWCLSPCSKDMYALHINCGGSTTTIGNRTYEADQYLAGSAKFVPFPGNWGTSSTGQFWDRDETSDDYTAKNVSVLRMNDSELYTTARLSPLSLTYYARCLANGNYTVTLHFAEIIFRDNRSYQSLGRRVFDVYLQAERKLKNFDIENEAQGVDKAVKRIFKAVVSDKILEIRFQYTGKGTVLVPVSGSYGP